MPKISMTVPHTLGQEEAGRRLSGFLDALRSRYKDQIKDLEENIEGNTGTFSFKTMGLKIKGDILVEEDQVNLNCDLPFAAMMFKGKIENEMREQLTKILS